MNSNIQPISPSDARSISANSLLLDVRTPAEFEEMHIDGAVLHPITELDPAKVRGLLAGKGACIAICRSGGRARKAAEMLASAGLEGVKVLEGGMTAWKGQGLPVAEGRKTMSLERQVRIGAGSLVLLGSAFAYFAHPAWIALPAFVGAGLVFAGVTDTCGMAMLLSRMPWNTRRASCSVSKSSCSIS